MSVTEANPELKKFFRGWSKYMLSKRRTVAGHCASCNKPFTAGVRRRYCDDRCRLADYRNRQRSKDNATS